MSPNRKMLELAAKAAGIASDGLGWCYDIQRDCAWNPLANDGDALRLAMRLGISFGIGSETGRPRITWSMSGGLHCIDMPEDHPLALPKCQMNWMRRAIVRAAAEIGRAIP